MMIGNDFNLAQNVQGINEFSKDIDNVNKLNNATTKLFANNGGTDENYLPEIKDVTI
jgi:hypothetical protein